MNARETGLYYLQSRYYNPTWGRFLNADAFVATGQCLLGNNMFAYCLNNPILYFDSTGTRAQIWSILFGDHDFGFIHRAVQAHIISMGLLQKELYLPGIGRADIYDPQTHELWEIKHGGSTSTVRANRILSAEGQVNNYICKSKEKNGLIYQKGCAGAFYGGFVLNCGNISYSVTYDTPEAGVILYYVEQMPNYIPEASINYISSSVVMKQETCFALIGLGVLAGLTCSDSSISFDPLNYANLSY